MGYDDVNSGAGDDDGRKVYPITPGRRKALAAECDSALITTNLFILCIFEKPQLKQSRAYHHGDKDEEEEEDRSAGW
jgi:hypothetical protein